MTPQQFIDVANFFYSNEFYRLAQDPIPTIQERLSALGIPEDSEDIAFLANLLIVQNTVQVKLQMLQEEESQKRVDHSIQQMRRAYQLTLIMLCTLFAMGVLFLIIAVLFAFTDNNRTGPAIVIGGVGILDLTFFLVSKPVDEVERGVGDLLQLRTVYNSYTLTLKQWQSHYDWQEAPESIKDKAEASEIIRSNAEACLALIQSYVRGVCR